MVIFGYVMAVVYIGLGCSLFFQKVFPGIPKNLKLTFALFFIAYGIFRLVKLRPKKSEINE
jgi:hypothetical protein